MRYLILLLFVTVTAWASMSEVDKQVVWDKNLMLNGGFENGKGAGVDKWTASAGAFSIATSGSNLLDGKVSFTWDAAASADTLSYGQVTIPNGLKGRNGILAAKIMVPSGTATHSLQVYDGTNVLGSVTIVSSTAPTWNYVNFIWPSSGYVQPRLYANANEPSITGDSFFLGEAEGINLTNISQATFYGGIEQPGATNCTYSESTSASQSDFVTLGGAASCTSPWTATGYITSGAVTLHQAVANNMPPGEFQIVLASSFTESGTQSCVYRLYDGTNGYQPQKFSGASYSTGNLIFHYTNANAGSRTFAIQASDDSTGCNIANATAGLNLSWKFYRFPATSQIAYNPSNVSFLWEGTHGTDCIWTVAAATISSPSADASCTFTETKNVNAGSVATTGSSTPGVVFTPNHQGIYDVCANIVTAGSAAQTRTFQLVSGDLATIYDQSLFTAGGGFAMNSNKLCARVNYTGAIGGSVTVASRYAASTGTVTISGAGSASVETIRWSISGMSNNIPSPLLVNSVSNTSSGASRIEAAKLNCDSGAAITSQHGSWVSSIGNVSAGACVVTLTTGIFSSTPYCEFTNDNANPLIMSVNPSSATSVTIDCDGNDGTDCTAYDGTLICVGPR